MQRDEELPHEVILAIQRVLNLQSGPETDPLDTLSNDFNPVAVLNSLFPDGMFSALAPHPEPTESLSRGFSLSVRGRAGAPGAG